VKYLGVTVILFISHSLCAQPSEVLSANKINRLLPTRIQHYQLKESRNDFLKFGSTRYSLCERIFFNKEKTIKMLLFDYGQAPIMYKQAMRKWSEMQTIDSDSAVFRETVSTFFRGWESYMAKTNHAQFVLGINNRFFMTLSGEQLKLEELRSILQDLDFENFPE
jgi:hypothetical protein